MRNAFSNNQGIPARPSRTGYKADLCKPVLLKIRQSLNPSSICIKLFSSTLTPISTSLLENCTQPAHFRNCRVTYPSRVHLSRIVIPGLIHFLGQRINRRSAWIQLSDLSSMRCLSLISPAIMRTPALLRRPSSAGDSCRLQSRTWQLPGQL